jgi:hypothetical protein
VEARRESIREANKIRRKQGLPRVPLPRRTKSVKPKKSLKRVSDTSATDEEAEITTDEEHYPIKTGHLKEKFAYEGRK